MRVFAPSFVIALAGVAAGQGLPLPPTKRSRPEDPGLTEALARWAPDIYQDVDDTKPAADLLTAIDFDGDVDMTNNWENLDGKTFNDLLGEGSVYTWGTRTATHDFLGYGFFHPQDWHDEGKAYAIGRTLIGKGTGEHENDFEGILLVIDRRTDEPVLMVTQAHNEFWQYGEDEDWGERFDVTRRGRGDTRKRREDLDGPIRRDPVTGRVQVFVEAKGHGVYGHSKKTDFDGKAGDGVLYSAGGSSLEKPRDDAQVASYDLESLTPWWNRFHALAEGEANETFTRTDGKVAFTGDTRDDNAANPPWGWRDGDYPDSVNDLFFTAPEEFVNWMFEPEGPYARTQETRTFSLDPTRAQAPHRCTPPRLGNGPGLTGVLRGRIR